MSASVRLGELCDPIRGITFPAAVARHESGPGYVACLTTSAVQEHVDWTRARYVPAAFVSSAQQLLQAGDVLVSTANSKALVGKSAVVTQVRESATFGAFVTVFRPRAGVSPAWFSLLLRSPGMLARLGSLASNTTNISNLNVGATLDLRVVVPPLEVQEDIARTCDAALTLVQAARIASGDAGETAEVLPKAVFREVFGGPAPLTAGPPVTQGGKSIALPLLSLARLESGHTPSRRHPEWWGGDVPWLALPDIRKLHGLIAYDTAEHTNPLGLANSSARLLPVGTVCVSRTASIGFVTMLGRPMATSQDFFNWVCDPDKLDAEYLMYSFMASFDHLRELGSGAVHKTIYMPTIQSFHLATPPIAEQRRIAQQLRGQLSAARNLKGTLSERQGEIDCLPQRILAAAFDDAT